MSLLKSQDQINGFCSLITMFEGEKIAVKTLITQRLMS